MSPAASSTLRQGLACLLAVAATACTVVDTRTLTLKVAGPTVVVDELSVVISAKDASTVRLAVDGQDVGAYPVGREVRVDVSAFSDGEHRVTASLSDAGRPIAPATTPFQISRPPTRVVATPPPGVVMLSAGFMATVEVTPAPAEWRAPALACGAVPFTSFTTSVPRPGMLQISTIADAPWDCSLSFSVVLVDGRGRTHALTRAVTWVARAAHVRLTSIGLTRNAFPVHKDITFNPAMTLADQQGIDFQLTVNGAVTPWPVFSVDVSTLPDGPVTLGALSTGALVDLEVVNPPVLDRVPPVLTATTERPGELGPNETIKLHSSEPLQWVYGSVVSDPSYRCRPGAGREIRPDDWEFDPQCWAPLPLAGEDFSFEIVGTDLAGNEGSITLSYSRPEWLLPAGTPEIQVAGAPVLASQVALSGDGTSILSWIAATADPNAGRVAVAVLGNGPIAAPVLLGQGGASSLAAARSQVGWIEATADGMGAVWAASASCAGCAIPTATVVPQPLSRGDRVVGQITVSGRSDGASPGHMAAWIETDATGGTSLVVGRYDATGLVERGLVPTSPGVVVSRPSVAIDGRYPVPGPPETHASLLSWLETPAVGNATLRLGAALPERVDFAPGEVPSLQVYSGLWLPDDFGGVAIAGDDAVLGRDGGNESGVFGRSYGGIHHVSRQAPALAFDSWDTIIGLETYRLSRLVVSYEGGCQAPAMAWIAGTDGLAPDEIHLFDGWSRRVVATAPSGSIRDLALHCLATDRKLQVAWIDADWHLQVRTLNSW